MNYRIFDSQHHEINTIVADESFVLAYCEENGYSYEVAPAHWPDPDPQPEATDTEVLNALLGVTE